MMYLWLTLEALFMFLAAMLMFKGEPGGSIFCAVLGVYAQNNRVYEGHRRKSLLGHYGIRMNP